MKEILRPLLLPPLHIDVALTFVGTDRIHSLLRHLENKMTTLFQLQQEQEEGVQQQEPLVQTVKKVGEIFSEAYAAIDEASVAADENTINKSLFTELTKKLPDFIIRSEEIGSGPGNYSRYHSSREDLSFYHVNICDGGELMAASVSSIEMEEIDELEAAAGESKMDVKSKNRWQLVAIMVKTAADVTHVAVKSGKLFKRIIIYGLLIDYKERLTKEIMKLTLDFEHRMSSLHISSPVGEMSTLEQPILSLASMMRPV